MPSNKIQVALGGILLYITVTFVLDLLFQEKPLFTRIKLGTFRFVRKLPFVNGIIKNQLKEPMKVL